MKLRLILLLSTLIWISGCATLRSVVLGSEQSSKNEIACETEFMLPCEGPVYKLPEGPLNNPNITAAMTKAEATAFDSCRVKHAEVVACIRRHREDEE